MSICFITGCSSGFGQSLALAFANRGDQVFATLRNPAAAAAALTDHPNICIAQLNVTDAESRAAALACCLDQYGAIDILINNAGIAAFGSIEDTPDELSRRIFETNFFAPLALMRAVLPVMRAQGGGRIINISAIGAVVATPLLGLYCASKHALDCAAAALDIEGRPFGVRAPSVLPGQFKTAIMGKEATAISNSYRGISDALDAARRERAADALDDYTLVVDATIAAATDPEPKARYVAGVGVMTEAILPTVAELEHLHAFSAKRCGIA